MLFLLIQIAEQFVSKYYNILQEHPTFIGRFYKDTSCFSVTYAAGDAAPARVETARGSPEVRACL